MATVRTTLRTIGRRLIGVGNDLEAETVALQLHVTIEGIETAEQLVLAGKLGCDSVQGFYFSKPVPAGEIEHRRDLSSYTLGQSPPAL